MSNEQHQPPELRMNYVDAGELGLPATPVSDVSQLRTALQIAHEENCNLLEPMTELQFVPPNHQVAITVVQFTTEGIEPGRFANNGLFYREENGELALSGKALGMIASAAGVRVIAKDTKQLEPINVQNFWRCQAAVERKSLTGEWLNEVRKHELDLRDGAPAATRAGSDKQLVRARQNGLMLCESKAYNRAIRHLMCVRSSYTMEQARAPFVFTRLLYMAPQTPEIQAMQAAAEMGISADVFGQRPTAEPAAQVIDIDDPSEAYQEQPQTAPPRQISSDPLQGADPRPAQEQRQREPVPARAQQGSQGGQQSWDSPPDDERWG